MRHDGKATLLVLPIVQTGSIIAPAQVRETLVTFGRVCGVPSNTISLMHSSCPHTWLLHSIDYLQGQATALSIVVSTFMSAQLSKAKVLRNHSKMLPAPL